MYDVPSTQISILFASVGVFFERAVFPVSILELFWERFLHQVLGKF